MQQNGRTSGRAGTVSTVDEDIAPPPHLSRDRGARWAEMLPPVASSKINNADGGLTEHIFPPSAMMGRGNGKHATVGKSQSSSDRASRQKWTIKPGLWSLADAKAGYTPPNVLRSVSIANYRNAVRASPSHGESRQIRRASPSVTDLDLSYPKLFTKHTKQSALLDSDFALPSAPLPSTSTAILSSPAIRRPIPPCCRRILLRTWRILLRSWRSLIDRARLENEQKSHILSRTACVSWTLDWSAICGVASSARRLGGYVSVPQGSHFGGCQF